MNENVYDKLKQEISQYEVVSFDIFDTLILRNVDNPKSIFDIVENIFNAKSDNKINGFKKNRIDSERKARSSKSSEVTLDEIYDFLSDYYSKDALDKLKLLEEQVELDVCQANPLMVEIYGKCIADNIMVIIISDMYLSRSCIEKMLYKCGYSGFEALLISCECGKTKSEGSLFDHALHELDIKPQVMIHIGDNYKSDILQAKKRGLNTFQVQTRKYINKKTTFGGTPQMDEMITDAFIVNNISPGYNIFQKVGFLCFGPLLFGYLKWIHEQILKNGCKDALFISRDGYIMKEVYEILYPESTVNVHYFYASRRALQVAMICCDPEYENVLSNMFVPRTVSVSWLVKRWGLDVLQYDEVLTKLGLKSDTSFDGKTIRDNATVQKLYNYLKDDIISNSEKEKLAFKMYLEGFKLHEKVAFIDIGWNGNMQNAFETMIESLGQNINVFGMYLGINPQSRFQHQYSMSGYLYQNNKNEELYYKTKYICSMLELFFMAPHGSTLKYCIKNNTVQVEKDLFEYENSETVKNMFQLQAAAFDYIEQFKKLSEYVSSYERVAFERMFRCFTNPSLSIAKAFGNLQMWDDKWIYIAERESVFNLLLHFKKVKNDFLHSSWKMGYLKRMFLLPLSYDKIIGLLRSRGKKSI